MPNSNFFLHISYDGTGLFGWQETQHGPSVEGILRATLEKILSHPVQLQAASRTDRGVHAHEQIVNFFSCKQPRIASLNSLLPPAIRVLSITERPLAAHPTLDAVGKEYRYWIDTIPVQSPFRCAYAWHRPGYFDLQAAQSAAQQLVGLHDFSAFCNRREGKEYAHKEREVWWISVEATPDGLMISIAGNQFLYKMVRNLVGSIVAVGRGSLQKEMLLDILHQKQRARAGVCAPAHGLSLYKIYYDAPKN